MAELKLTDQEIGFVSLAIAKVDPTGIVDVAEGIRQKIRVYAEERNREQMAMAAATAETENPQEAE